MYSLARILPWNVCVPLGNSEASSSPRASSRKGTLALDLKGVLERCIFNRSVVSAKDSLPCNYSYAIEGHITRVTCHIF